MNGSLEPLVEDKGFVCVCVFFLTLKHPPAVTLCLTPSLKFILLSPDNSILR